MKILYGLFSLYSLLILVSSEVEIKEEEGVLVLTKENFKNAITDNEFILVEFYAPWCGHCKALAPQYEKAAKDLAAQNSKIKLAKVDATIETSLGEEYGIRGYPTLKFFKSGTPVEYNGGRQADEIVNWLKKKTGPPAIDLKNVDSAKEFIESNSVAIIGFFKDQTSLDCKAFLQAALTIDELPFGIASEEGIYPEFDSKDGEIVLFKQFDEKKNVFTGEISVDNLKNFVTTYSLPLVVDFNPETAKKIFGGEIKNHLLLFLSKNDEFDKFVEQARSVATPFREKILFVSIDTDEPDHSRILEFFGMTKTEIPSMRIIQLDQEMKKFKPEINEITPENIKSFVEKFLDGSLKQHLLSQELPTDWDKNPVKVLVASNFDEVVFDETKDVLVEFYAPWCGHCKELLPIYEKLGEKFADSNEIIVAKMDATVNELEHTKIVNFPTIKLFKKNNNEVVEYNGERTLEGLSKFLESGGEYGKAAPDTEEEFETDEKVKDEL